MGSTSCTWNGTSKNLKNFLKWFQEEYQELGLTEIQMRPFNGRFEPHQQNRVTLTGDDGEYEAEIGIRTNTTHHDDYAHRFCDGHEDDEIVWTDPRPVNVTEHVKHKRDGSPTILGRTGTVGVGKRSHKGWQRLLQNLQSLRTKLHRIFGLLSKTIESNRIIDFGTESNFIKNGRSWSCKP